MIALVILVWVVNFGLSVWNAYAVGKGWVETRHHGGWPRFMAWMGAIMSASGFTWCYLILLGLIAYGLNWLSADQLELALSLGYILLIPGILFAGLMIMLDSWARAYRSRKILDFGVAAWNTYAQIHNTYNAINGFGKAFSSVADSLSSRKSDRKGAGIVVVIILVAVALLAGLLTTSLIISRVAGNDELPMRREEYGQILAERSGAQS
jgi:hypothetical protein